MKPQPLYVETVPLHGVRLIEASAGTGKTYTITSLYVRLVLGHECVPLSPEKILVVTFTRAATEELRDRIRKRLKQALAALQGDVEQDGLIALIVTQLADIDEAKQRLKDAMQVMDMAAIYTIHGFAQRLLRQNAMESSVSDDFELSLDEAELVQQAVRDVWRSQVYPAQGRKLSLILQNWQTPDDLQAQLASLLHKDVDFHLGPAAADYEQASADFERAHARLAQQWQTQGGAFIEQIRSNPKANGSFTRYLESRVQTLDQLLSQADNIKVKDAKVLAYFTTEGLKKSVKKGGSACAHELVQAFDDGWQHFQQLAESRVYASNQLLIALLQATRQRLKQLKNSQGILAPDDLLSLLNEAIAGATGPQLLEQIRGQYPVAMVDEFQDTDALQYRVFAAIYQDPDKQSPEPQKKLAMFMIGDPKQAIYKFRGADIFTYIQAKRAVDGAYSLGTNYRSSAHMVAAVNGLFSRHKRPFIYDQDIPFAAVEAKGDAAALYLQQQRAPALSWVQSDGLGKTSKLDIAADCSEGSAQQICQLLNDARAGEAVLKGGTASPRSLLAQDVAVLVRSAKQAKWIKDALSKRGIGSVYVGRESIFQTDQAMAMFALLQAIHMVSEAQFRNAMAHPVWCVSLHSLQQFMEDEALWEQQLEQLYACRELWQQKGVMAMFMHWLHHRDLPATWLAHEHIEGERCLTNFLHLAELLQDASTQVQGLQGLVSWLSHKISIHLGQQDQQMLRLESDANLVQIVTIHKSKGLEYPVVFLPFAWDGKESSDPLFYDTEQARLRCDLVGDFAEQRVTEGLAEEVRLLYVALTRASAKCYVAMPKGVSDKKLEKTLKASALYHVLAQGELAGLSAALLTQAEQPHYASVYQVLTMPSEQGSLSKCPAPQDLSVRRFNGNLKQNWFMSSFSSLIRHVHAPMSARLNQDEDEAHATQDMPPEQTLGGAFAFPRGAHAGNFLHTLLEEIDFSELPPDLEQLIGELLSRFSIESHWLAVMKDWLNDILQAPLLPSTATANGQPELTLQALGEDKKLVEMEFYFPVSRLRAADFNHLLNRYPCLEVPTKPTDFRQLRGMLKGFVDLIFEWRGQYFILDYKSNYLGDDHAAYHQVATHEAMSEHRYDVQLVIYTLALHRLLQLRIADYDYDVHMGGAYYLFLRGLQANDQQHHYGQYFHKPDKQLIESLDALIKEEQVAAPHA